MNGFELVTAGHPGWQVAPHPQIRGTLTAERRRANSIRDLVATDVTVLLVKIEEAQNDEC
jgi:hypothetical protein